jgi:hypothetical protein
MGFAGKDELHRALRVGQQPQQPVRVPQQQVGPLVRREAACKTQRQGVGVEEMLSLLDIPRRGPAERQLAAQPAPGKFDESHAADRAQFPKASVRD